MSAPLIRPARAQDAAQIVQIWNHVIETSQVTFTTTPKTPAQITEDIARRGALFQVASTTGTVLGFATAFQFRGGNGYAHTYEHSVMVSDTARGQGIGRDLISALCLEAHTRGIHSLIASISSANPQAVSFHETLGFRQVGYLPEAGQKWGQWLDLILMQKILTSSP